MLVFLLNHKACSVVREVTDGINGLASESVMIEEDVSWRRPGILLERY